MKNPAITLLAAALLVFSGDLHSPAQTPKVQAPVQFKQLPSTPINLHMNEDSKAVYQALGKLLGLTVVFDPDYQSKVIQVDMTDATAGQAVQLLGDLTKTYVKPVTSDTILVIPDTLQKHRDLDEQDSHIFYLKNITQSSDADDIYNALRFTLSNEEARTFLVPGQNAIVVTTSPENIARAQSLMDELNKPKKNYRLTYTVTEVDGAKKISSQQFTMILTDGQKTSLNQSSKVPIATGTYTGSGSVGVQTQFTYMDVGLKFDATLYGTAAGARLNSSVTQSAFIDEKSIAGVQEPVVRQLNLEGSAVLTNGRPAALGSMDIPGSTHHLEVEVVMEPLP